MNKPQVYMAQMLVLLLVDTAGLLVSECLCDVLYGHGALVVDAPALQVKQSKWQRCSGCSSCSSRGRWFCSHIGERS